MTRTKPKPLTPMFLRHVKRPASGQVEIADGACPGLRLRLATSVATWVLGCRDAAGHARRFRLGEHPAMGLKEAREAARELRAKVRKGADPIAEARQQRAEARRKVDVDEGLVTLSTVMDAYGRAVGASKRSWPRARQQIENVFGKKLARTAIEITAPELQLIVDAHPSATSAGTAVRYAKPVLKWAAKRGLMAVGIADALEPPEGAQRVRQRVLSRDEIRAILRAAEDVTGYGPAMRWLFLTGARLNEACLMRWSDIDQVRGLWILKQTKQDRPHTVPLPRQALDLLREQHRGADDGLVFINSVANRLSRWDPATKRIQAVSGTTDWHRHDIRRTVATMLGDMGTAPHVIEVVLGHALRTSSDGSVVSRIAATYNKSRYRPEHADALQKLADELDRIVAGEDEGARVVRLRA
jgi:integrase